MQLGTWRAETERGDKTCRGLCCSTWLSKVCVLCRKRRRAAPPIPATIARPDRIRLTNEASETVHDRNHQYIHKPTHLTHAIAVVADSRPRSRSQRDKVRRRRKKQAPQFLNCPSIPPDSQGFSHVPEQAYPGYSRSDWPIHAIPLLLLQDVSILSILPVHSCITVRKKPHHARSGAGVWHAASAPRARGRGHAHGLLRIAHCAFAAVGLRSFSPSVPFSSRSIPLTICLIRPHDVWSSISVFLGPSGPKL